MRSLELLLSTVAQTAWPFARVEYELGEGQGTDFVLRGAIDMPETALGATYSEAAYQLRILVRRFIWVDRWDAGRATTGVGLAH